MEEKGRGGKTALHILAFIGITVLLLVIACLAAAFIATKGPSEAARDNVVVWAEEHGLGFAAGLFLSAEEENAILNPSDPAEDVQPSATPFIVVTDGQPEPSDAAPEESVQPEESAAPESSEAPEESPAASDGEEAAA